MIAVAAKYGMIAVHFYWIGAIPALAFLLCVLLPRYQQHGIRTVPEYFNKRFGSGARLLSAGSFCVLMVAVAGITLCVASRLMHLALGWSYSSSIWLMALATAAFLLAGGLSGVIYSEAVQLIIFLVALVPLTVMTLRNAGGLMPLIAALGNGQRHALKTLPWFSPHATIDLLGVVFGLGFVLSFSYWCADFQLIQRLCAAKNSKEMLRTPGIAILAKLVLPLLLVVPGVGAATMYGGAISGSFDLSLPRLLLDRYPSSLAALAIAAVIASLFFGICSNISAGVAIFASDIYRTTIRPNRPDSHYLNAGRLLIVFLAVSAAGSSYLAFGTSSLMDYIQLILSSLNAPIATVLLLGIFFPHLSRRSGSAGLLAGTAAGLLNWYASHAIQYGSGLSESFYGAIFSALSSAITMFAVTHLFPDQSFAQTRIISSGQEQERVVPAPLISRVLATVALLIMCGLYLVFR